MPKIEFNPSVSVGNVLTLVALVLSAAVAWGSYRVEVDELKRTITKHEEEINSVDETNRTLERSFERILERMDSIKATLDRLEKRP